MCILKKIKCQIKDNPILIYMKGTPETPHCGFSAQAVKALSSCGEKFAYVDILEHPDIRVELPKYAHWPTFPQLWVDGKLIGGCNIIMDMLKNNTLQELISSTVLKYKDINK